MVWILLLSAIAIEVVATASLKQSDGFTKFTPSLIALLCYAIAFFLLSKVAMKIQLGIAYAIWSGVGISLVTLVGWVYFNQKIDAMALIGIGLIIVGVIILSYSESISI